MLGFTRLLRRAREAEADEATDASDEDSASCSSEGSDVFFEASEVAASGGEEDFAPASAPTRRASFDVSRASLDVCRSRASLEMRGRPPPQNDGVLPEKHWADGEYSFFRLRGASYLSDRKKQPAGFAICVLAGMELWTVERHVSNVAALPGSWLQRQRRAGLRSFVFTVCFQNPGSAAAPRTSMVMSFAAAGQETLDELLAAQTPFARSLRRYVGGEHNLLKLIPCILEGPPLVRGLLPRTPVLVTKNVPQTVTHVGANSITVDIDVSSCRWADRFFRHIFHRVAGSLVGDIAFLLEGRSAEELPETLLAVAHVANVAPELARVAPWGLA